MDIYDLIMRLLPIAISAYALIKSNTKADAVSATTVIVKLESIEKGITEIKTENKDLRATIRALENRVTVLETLLKGEHDGK